MNKKTILLTIASFCAAAIALVGQADMIGRITKSYELAVIAVPDFRASGEAQPYMGVFNSTLFQDLQDSGYLRMAPKSMYPLQVPQRPQDWKPPVGTPPRSQGPWLTDWSNPPVGATYLPIGYAGVQNGQMVLFGWFYNVGQQDLANAQVFNKLYIGTLNEEGARKLAHEFAADILSKLGVQTLAGSKIIFTSTRGGGKEIWSMDHDGANQKQITRLGSTTSFAAVSPDATRLAFTTFARGNPSVMVYSLETMRQLPFYNQRASLNATPAFTPDGKQIIFSSTAAGGAAQLYMCNVDGSGLKRVTYSNAIDIEPKFNPKNQRELVFVSGRGGPPQIYKMNVDGTDVVRLTSGEGDAVNPAWHPDGQFIAFSWTRGFAPGNYNLFIMDVATKEITQLTHGAGRNENPSWAPDGRHLVFSSNRSGSTQIWTMLANGTKTRQLTTQGRNENPVWSK
ncbi:MAG: PD40 domain-containing protein [Acidobacteria bacterium]|nr:PD40 domain-containing protein [Acidobacteriota bacterium]